MSDALDALRAIAERVSNIGRWGADDERGTLNLIDDATRRRAVLEVRTGRAYSIGLDVDLSPSPPQERSARLTVVTSDSNADRTVSDELSIAVHGFATTHVDALGHCFYDGLVYGDRAVSDALDELRGLRFASITAQRHGVMTRGILLDVARSRGVERLEPGTAVEPADLEAAEKLAQTRVRSGDAIFVYVGTPPAADMEGDPLIRAGLSAECLVWMHERDVAVYSGDCVDVLPSPHPSYPDYLHQIALSRMGLVFLDNPDVGALRGICETEGRSTFLVSYAPLRIPGGTGSAVNPVVTF